MLIIGVPSFERKKRTLGKNLSKKDSHTAANRCSAEKVTESFQNFPGNCT